MASVSSRLSSLESKFEALDVKSKERHDEVICRLQDLAERIDDIPAVHRFTPPDSASSSDLEHLVEPFDDQEDSESDILSCLGDHVPSSDTEDDDGNVGPWAPPATKSGQPAKSDNHEREPLPDAAPFPAGIQTSLAFPPRSCDMPFAYAGPFPAVNGQPDAHMPPWFGQPQGFAPQRFPSYASHTDLTHTTAPYQPPIPNSAVPPYYSNSPNLGRPFCYPGDRISMALDNNRRLFGHSMTPTEFYNLPINNPTNFQGPSSFPSGNYILNDGTMLSASISGAKALRGDGDISMSTNHTANDGDIDWTKVTDARERQRLENLMKKRANTAELAASKNTAERTDGLHSGPKPWPKAYKLKKTTSHAARLPHKELQPEHDQCKVEDKATNEAIVKTNAERSSCSLHPVTALPADKENQEAFEPHAEPSIPPSIHPDVNTWIETLHGGNLSSDKHGSDMGRPTLKRFSTVPTFKEPTPGYLRKQTRPTCSYHPRGYQPPVPTPHVLGRPAREKNGEMWSSTDKNEQDTTQAFGKLHAGKTPDGATLPTARNDKKTKKSCLGDTKKSWLDKTTGETDGELCSTINEHEQSTTHGSGKLRGAKTPDGAALLKTTNDNNNNKTVWLDEFKAVWVGKTDKSLDEIDRQIERLYAKSEKRTLNKQATVEDE